MRTLFIFLLGLSLISCAEGPSSDALKGELQAHLDQAFGADTFEISALKRRGHYPFSVDGDDRDHLLVYFKAKLTFKKAYKLSNWDQLNVNSLISIMGATVEGVEGVEPNGNKAGDTLRVFGTATFADSGEAWTPEAPKVKKKKKATPANDEKLPYRQKLDEIAAAGKALHKAKAEAELTRLNHELDVLLSAVQRKTARARGDVTFATGSRSGEYFRQGESLAKLLTTKVKGAVAFETKGSEENCRLVNSGEVTIGYTQNDVARQAYNGRGRFEVPHRELRALASLYPEAVQIVTLAKSEVKTLADLKGRAVNVGARGSGVRANALVVLAAAGLAPKDLKALGDRAPKDAVAALEAGEIDAMFFTSAFPSPLISGLAAREPVRLIALDDATLTAIKAQAPFLLPLEIPKVYAGMKRTCNTVGVTAMLVARADASTSEVARVLETLFSQVDALSKDSLQAYFISKDTAQRGLTLPLHPAAKAFFSN